MSLFHHINSLSVPLPGLSLCFSLLEMYSSEFFEVLRRMWAPEMRRDNLEIWIRHSFGKGFDHSALSVVKVHQIIGVTLLQLFMVRF